MGVFGGLVQEDVLDDHAFHRHQARGHVLGVRVRLRDVLALDVEALEGARHRLVEHVGDAQPGIPVEGHAPEGLEHLPRRIVGDVAVAGELVREGAHVAGALHVVLPAQRVHAHAGPADVAGGHGQVRHAHDHGRALAVLGDAQAVIDRRIARIGVEAGCSPHVGRGHARQVLDGLGGVALVGDEAGPALEVVEVAALAHVISSISPSVTITWAMALMIATFVPGSSGRW
jgi:hypothetical protein